MTHRRAEYLSELPSERPVPQFLEVGVLEATGDDAAREVTGLLLPYGEDLERMDWLTGATKQRFAPNSGVVRENAALFYGHDHLDRGMPIGRITSSEQTDKGLRVVAKISKTAKGDEVYTLLKDRVLTKFSAGYYPGKAHLEDNDSTLVHDEIDVFEGSVVQDPAYQSADVDSVLSNKKEAPMPCTKCGKLHPAGVTECQVDPSTLASAEDVSTLSTAVEDLTRKVATLGAGGPEDTGPAVPYRSYGEFLNRLAHGEKEALDFLGRIDRLIKNVDENGETLAYAGGTTDDLGDYMKDTWVGERFKFIEAQRTTLNFFSRTPLPATGMGIEYGVEGTDTTQVAEQVNEGDVLAYGKIDFDTDNAKLKTYGGWGDMSLQKIQRSPINVVERFFNSLLRRYAQVTEAAVNAETLAAGIALTGGVLDLGTADGWTKFVIRAARRMKDRGYPIEAILVGYDVFEEVALLRTGTAPDAPYFLNRTTGTIDVKGLSGEMFNLPILPFETGVTTNVVRAANSEAIRTYEAPGAPFRLQDADITNLTQAFSVYGYMAKAREVPGAIIKPQTV